MTTDKTGKILCIIHGIKRKCYHFNESEGVEAKKIFYQWVFLFLRIKFTLTTIAISI